MHISLDGFVAGPNGEMDWIKVDDALFKYVEQRIGKGDTAMYGRITYQMMEAYWPTAGNKPGATRHDVEHSKWYGKIRKVVLSRTLKETVLDNTTIISNLVPEKIMEIKNTPAGGNNEILLFGSPSATHSLIELDLIDGYWLFVNPIILGKGIPLFAGVKERTKLKLINTKQFDCGVTELNYIVAK